MKTYNIWNDLKYENLKHMKWFKVHNAYPKEVAHWEDGWKHTKGEPLLLKKGDV
jgi:hypothetical protein